MATDLHGLHTHHLVGHDTDKVHILRRIAIDPFFIFGFAISLAHFFRRLALGVQHHFRIHSNQHTVRLNGLFHLRRHGIQIRLLFVSRIEIEHRMKHLAQLSRRHFRNIFVEINIQIGSVGIGLRLIGTHLHGRPVGTGNLDMLVPFLTVNGTTVEVEMNVVVLNQNEGDVSRIPRLNGWSIEGESLLQIRTCWRGQAIFQLQPFGPHRKSRARIENLHLEVTDDFQARLP